MGITKAFKRLHYVYSWRLRFWWFDADSGKRAQVGVFVVACLWLLFLLVRKTVEVYLGVKQDSLNMAVAPWVVWVVQVLVSLAIAYATRPRPETPKPQQQTTPTTEDGAAVIDAFGTVWVDDSFQLAHKNLPPKPIKTKGGKK